MNRIFRSLLRTLAGLALVCNAAANPFPPTWGSGTASPAGPIHFAPAPWPSEPAVASQCGQTCGAWKPYTRFQGDVNDPRVQDPSNGGTAPQNYVNVSSSCIDKTYPSIYYYLHKGAAADGSQDVIMFRWRVEQIANNYATGPSAGNYGATDPWSSGLWTVLFDVDGDGYRDLAAHLNGSSGGPSTPVDMIAGVWGNIPTQSVDYLTDPNIHLIAHNPTAFVGNTGKILNFHGTATAPDESWPNGSAETVWDYGTSRARLVYTSSCNEYFVDYQIPARMLDASADGPSGKNNGGTLDGPKITRDTPISMLFCTANSLNNPFQKDCALNRSYIGDTGKPGPFGDYLSFNKEAAYAQPIVASVTATAPTSCASPSYQLSAKVQDTLHVNNGVVEPSIKEVKFYYWYDQNGNDAVDAGDTGSQWTEAATGILKPGTLNAWTALWNASGLLKGRYFIGVQAVDDKTKHDDGVPDAPVDNRTFSYIVGSSDTATQAQVYNNDWSWNGATKTWVQNAGEPPADSLPGWLSGQAAVFPDHLVAVEPGNMSPSASEDWYGNPDVTGTQIATAGVDLAINACGKAPTITKVANPTNIATGETTTFTVTITNTTGASITVTRIDDMLPLGFKYTSTTSLQNNGSDVLTATNPAPDATGTVSWTLNDTTGINVANNTSVVLIFVATAGSTAGTYNNTASAQSSFGPLTSAPVAVQVDSARISLDKTPNTYLVNPGGSVTYTLNYSNDSAVTVTNATITDTLPSGVTYSGCTGGSTCGHSAGTVTWNLGTLAGGATGSVSLTVSVNSDYNSSSLTNSATLTVRPPGWQNSTDDLTQTATSTIAVNVPTPAFALAKTASAIQVAPGGTVTWTITYHNFGSGPATGVVINDPLPAGFTYQSCAFTGGTPGGATCLSTLNNVAWDFGSNTIAAGASGSVTVTATAASPTFNYPNPAHNVARITWTGGPANGVTATSDVGVTGQSCSAAYFFKAGGATSTTPPTGTGTSFTTGTSGTSTVFTSDPVSSPITLDNNVLSVSMYIDAGAGGADLNVLVERVNASDVATTITSYTKTNVPNASGWFSFSFPFTSGTPALAAGERLRWTFTPTWTGNKTFTFYYDGFVSAGTIYADSRSSICATSPPANLTLNKTVNLPNVTSLPANIQYTLTFANTGGTDATNVTLQDALPANVTMTGATLNGVPVSLGATPYANPYTFTVNSTTGATGTVKTGESGTLVIQATVGSGASGSLTNTATLDSDQTEPVQASATTIAGSLGAGGSPALSLSKRADKTSLSAGEIVTYTLTVVNTGLGDASNISVTDLIPSTSWFTYVPGSMTGATPGTPADTLGGDGIIDQLAWTIASLGVGQKIDLGFQMQVAATGVPAGITDRLNNASMTGGGYCTTASVSGCTSNDVTVYVSGNPRLSIVKTASSPTPPATSFAPGDTVTYTLTVTNSGSSAAAALTVTDPIPANMSFAGGLGASDDDGGNGSWTKAFDAVENRVVYTVDSLGPGKVATLSFNAVIGDNLANGPTVLTNTATVSAANAPSGSASANSTASAAPVLTLSKTGPTSLPYPAARLTANASASSTTLKVDSSANLEVGQWLRVGSNTTQVVDLNGTSIEVAPAITSAAGNGTAVIGSATYSLSYGNTGNAPATGVLLTDTLPALLAFQGATAGGNHSGGVVTWNLGTLAPNAGGTVQVTVFPTGSGSATNNASLDSVETTPVTDTLDLVIGGLVVTKATSTPTQPAPGTAIYTITVSNTTGSTISAVAIKDVLPSSFTYKANSTVIGGSPASEPTFEKDIYNADDVSRPIWTIDIPTTGQTITFQANIAASVGPATYQNGVELTAAAGVGITPFDPLLTTAEDVTVLAPGTGIVQGTVYRDNDANGAFDPTIDTPLPDVLVTIIDDTGTAYVAYTDAAGHFSRVVSAGTTIVDIDDNTLPAGLKLTTGTDGSDPSLVVVPEGGIGTDNSGYVPVVGAVGTIRGQVWLNNVIPNNAVDPGEYGLLGVQVLLRDPVTNAVIATAYTDVLGNYAFPNIPVGDYVVDVVPTVGYVTNTPDPVPVNLASNATATVNFGLITGTTTSTGSISGNVWYDTLKNGIRDAGEPGRAGWTVQLYSGGQLRGTTTTGANGDYQFDNLQPGSYTVRFFESLDPSLTPVDGDPNHNGGTPIGGALVNINVPPGTGVLDQSLPIDPSGVVYDSQTRQAISGATVTLLLNGGSAAACVINGPSSIVTGANGVYAFFIDSVNPACGGPGNEYSLVVSRPGYTFVSTSIPAQPGAWPSIGGSIGTSGPPTGGQTTVYYLRGPRPTDDLTNNNIPLDPVAGPVVGNAMPIPTLSTWSIAGLSLLALLLGLSAQRRIQSRRALQRP